MKLTKRIFAAMLALCLLLTLVPAAFAQGTGGNCGINGDNVKWSYDDNGHLRITGTGDMRAYTENYCAPWYKYSDYIVSVVIDPDVTGIGDYAFYWCDKLTSVTIPDSVTGIGGYAFYCCKALTGITIPNSVTSIGGSAFANCTALTSVVIPGSVTCIGEHAFDYCTELTSVTIQDGVESIGARAFYLCYKLEDIAIDGIVASIGKNVFESTAYYDDDANWENGVLYIGKCLIAADQSIAEEYTVKSGTKTIADEAFLYYVSLTGITLPDGIVYIGDNAFNDCHNLTGIEIPKSVAHIGNNAFYNCVNLTDISVADGNVAYYSENGILYNNAKTEIIRFPSKKADTSFTIPDGVTGIADGAFDNCRNLTGITIPDSAASIGDSAFANCFGLTEITIPDGVTSIGNNAFYQCTALTDVTIPNSITSIGNNAFLDCDKLNKVYYIGTENDWRNIIKGNKYSIADSIIHYCSGISAKRSDDGKIIVKPITDTGKTVILALYDGEKGDRFIEIQSEIYNGAEITFTPTQNYTLAKVMIWKSLDSLSSVCDYRTLKN